MCAIRGIFLRIDWRYSAKRISPENSSIVHVISFQDSTHENRRPAAPNTGLDQIAGNRLVEDPLDEFLDVVQALPADHGERLVGRPLAPFVDMRTRLVNVVENYVLRELKVKAAKMLFPLCFGEEPWMFLVNAWFV